MARLKAEKEGRKGKAEILNRNIEGQKLKQGQLGASLAVEKDIEPIEPPRLDYESRFPMIRAARSGLFEIGK
jgi:hypothetical protein